MLNSYFPYDRMYHIFDEQKRVLFFKALFQKNLPIWTAIMFMLMIVLAMTMSTITVMSVSTMASIKTCMSTSTEH